MIPVNIQSQVKGKSDTTKVKKKRDALALEPGRKIPLKTDEGTWMSLDISPDGQTIAYPPTAVALKTFGSLIFKAESHVKLPMTKQTISNRQTEAWTVNT